jgi:hypothetical protein
MVGKVGQNADLSPFSVSMVSHVVFAICHRQQLVTPDETGKRGPA